MSINCRILADSRNPSGHRLTSWLLTYPRLLHSEVMTHRAASKNSASSRAIPFAKMVDAVNQDCDVIERWTLEQKGMQGFEAADDLTAHKANLLWHKGCGYAMEIARAIHKLGIHKSIPNRGLEPYAHMTVVLTMSDHSNFFALRAHPMALPEFQVLAYRMLHAYLLSTPQEIPWGGWHIPQFDGQHIAEENDLPIETKLRIATARCARTSYTTQDKDNTIESDLAIVDKLLTAPMHASPFEHCAQAYDQNDPSNEAAGRYYIMSNFDTPSICNWLQYRKLFPNECASGYDQEELAKILDQKPEWITL